MGSVKVLVINSSHIQDNVNQWEWSRDLSSLALGDIIEETAKTPTLIVKFYLFAVNNYVTLRVCISHR